MKTIERLVAGASRGSSGRNDAAFNEIWGEVSDEDILEAVFGDHVQITITRDEVTVEDYSHD